MHLWPKKWSREIRKIRQNKRQHIFIQNIISISIILPVQRYKIQPKKFATQIDYV